MLTVTNVAKLFADTIILEECSFVLRAGERVALVGPNGAGKTTLLKIAAGALRPDRGAVVYAAGARSAYLQQDAGVEPGRTVHDEMASVFGRVAEIEARQRELESEITAARADESRLMALVEEQGALHAEFEQLDGYAAESRIGRVLAGLGFKEEDWGRPTEQFSGGWQMRIALAKLLLQAPDVLLLDEPTNHLDLEATEWLEEFLVESRTAAVVVSHDRYFMDKVTKRTLELRDGKINDFPMAYSRYAVERRDLDERQVAAHERQKEYLEKQRAYIERFRASPTRHTLVQSREKMINKIERIDKPRETDRIAFRFATTQASGREALKLEDVRKVYGDRVVLDRVDLLIERGERIGLVGPNGSGKSTLLRLLAKVEKPDKGHVYAGHNVQTVFYTQTQAEALDGRKTALEELRDAAPYGTTEQELRDNLGRFLISQDEVDKSVGVLSGGERSRLALAKLLMRPANLLLLDEPTNHLDIGSREVLEAALKAYPGTAIIASHDRYLLDRIATRILEVGERGVRSFVGNYSRYRERKVALANAPSPTRGRPPGGPGPSPARASDERASRKGASTRPSRLITGGGAGQPARLTRLETELEQLQRERARLEKQLADPTLWADHAEASKVVEQMSGIQTQIDQLTGQWEQAVAAT